MPQESAQFDRRAAIAASLRRSELTGLSPDLSELPYHSDLPGDSRLLRAAAPVLDKLALSLADSPVSILLADPSARIVDRRVGIRQFMSHLDRTSVAPGFELSEQATGTNAIGTALESRNLILVQGDDHYRDALRGLACAGLPIIHPISKRIEGILDITARVADASPMMIPLVEAAAREIEQRLYEMASLDERATLEAFLSASKRGSSAVIALSNDFVLSTPAASRLLQPSDQSLLWQWASANLRDEQSFAGEFVLADATRTRAVARRNELDGRTSGIIVELTPEVDSPVLGLAPVGNPSPRPLESKPKQLQRMNRIVAEVALDPGPTLVTGGPGAGKRYTAQQLHRQWSTGEIGGWDFAQFTPGQGDGWEKQVAAAAERGNTVILRHMEYLDDHGLRRMFALFNRANERGWRMIVTGTDAPQELVAEAHSYFRRRIEVPPLLERLEEIAKEILSRFAPGRPTPRLQAAALQALMSQQWPSNIRELESVLHSAATRALGGDIGIQHLPANYRETTSQRALSSLERVERDALIRALEESHGNKSKAAKLLGVARSTFYRKAREFGIDVDRFVG